jgi:transposase
MGKQRSLTMEIKKIINLEYDNGMKQIDIAKKYKVAQSTVSNIILEKKKKGFVTGHNLGAGRKRKTTSRDERILQRLVRKNGFTTVNDYKEKLETSNINISKSTIERRLKEYGFKKYVPLCKPQLSSKQRKRRVEWARKYVMKGEEFWNKVIFSDESSFVLPIGENGKIWRKKGEGLKPQNTTRSLKHPASQMLWGCMTSQGLGRKIFVKGMINSLKYQEILSEGLLFTLEDIHSHGEWIFQQDLASPHSSKSTHKWFLDNDINTLEWPANSPDLNPIENVWNRIKFMIRKTKPLPRTKQELQDLISKLWEDFSPNFCENLIKTMPKRCREVIKSKGYPTKY